MYKSLKLLLVILLAANMSAFAQTIFNTVGGPYSYTVPVNVTGITVNVQGAMGGQNSDELDYPDRGGYGGCVQAVITVTPGQVLQVYVGGCGGNGSAITGGGAGGFNGGGAGSNQLSSIYAGGGGGGSSDIRIAPYSPDNRIVVAAGGGGAGIQCGLEGDRGGDGGSPSGETGAGCTPDVGGGGGTTAAGIGYGGFSGTSSGTGSPGSAGTGSPLPGTGAGGAGGNNSAGGGGGGGWGGGGGGQWDGGGGGSDYIASGVSPISDFRGCNTTGCGSVSITVTCTAGSIAGDPVVCQGSTTHFTDPIPGGTWISGNPSVGTIDGTTGIFTGLAGGTAIISYEFISGTPGCRAVTTVTVNPLPAAISSSFGYYCVGSSYPVSDATPGGTWSIVPVSGIGSISPAGSTATIYGTGAGSLTVSYTLPTGCASTLSIPVIAPPPPITGPTWVCQGSSITLSDLVTTGTWYVTAGATITPTGGVLTGGVPAGVKTVSYTVSGCSAFYTVTVYPLPVAIGGPTKVCMGSTITVTDASSPGTWSITPGTTGSATISPGGVITPVSTGTVTVTWTLATTCSVSEIVTINPLPAVISGPVEVCKGATIPLTDGSGTTTWTSSNTAIATVGSATGIVTGTAAAGGVATITFTIPATGCYTTHVVTVDPLPPPITGPDPVCVGSCSTEVSGAAGTGTWSSSITTFGTIDPVTGIFCATAAGSTEVIKFTYTTTGCFQTRTMTVNPNPAPIVGPDSVCEGSCVNLTEATGSGTWGNIPGTGTVSGSAVGTTLTVCGLTAGTDTINYVLPTGCTAILPITVNLLPAVITGSTVNLCEGDSTQLVDATPGGTWSSSMISIATVGSTGWVKAVGPATSGGVATITYTLPAGGCYQTYTMTIVGKPTISGPTSMCVTDPPITLTGGGGAGTWSSGSTSVATIGLAGDVTPVGVGTSQICYTFTAPPGCFVCEQFTVNAVPPPISGPSTVCVGATITLTSGFGGSWSASNGAATVPAGVGNVTGVSTVIDGGVDTIYYTVGSGCKSSKTVTVEPSPAPITAPVTTVCQGLTITLTDPTPGGMWSSTFPGTGSVNPIFGTTTNVTGVSGPGTTTVSYTVAGCSRTVVITVTTLPGTITGPNPVCQGPNVTWSMAPTSGTWTSAVGAVASVTAGPATTTTITLGVPGQSLITFTGPGGCSTSKTITVNATPTALITPLGSTNLCPGDVLALTATTGAGYTYQWSKGGVPIAGATNATYLTGVAGAYTVTIMLGSCPATSPAVNVTVNPVIATLAPSGTINTCYSTPPLLTAGPVGAGITYQWIFNGTPIAGAGGVAGTYSASVAGTYTVKVTNSFGCSSISPAATVTLATSPLAVITASGPTSFCSGGSVTLTTGAGPGYTYQWKLGGLPIAGATNISFTATVSGTYTVMVSNTTGCTTTSAGLVVTLTPPPVTTITITGSLVFCSGGSVVLNGLLVAGDSYQWYKNGVAITGATTSVYLATATGSYTLKVTNTASGCSATSTPVVVTVMAVPLISPLSATTFCWGGSVTLSAIITGGVGAVTYQWYKNGVAIIGATGPSYIATTTGLYSVQVTIVGPGGCGLLSATTYVTENPLPNPLITFDGTYFHTGAFVTYQWYKNLIPIPGGTTAVCHNTGIGSYTVIVTDINGCQSSSTAYVLTHLTPRAAPSGVENTGQEDIKIFPNPAQATVHIESTAEVRAVICSMDGRTVIDQAAARDVDISRLADGIYMIKLYDTDGQMVKAEKLVKASN